MKRDNRVYIEDIRDAIGKIEEYTDGLTYEDFVENTMCQDAVIRQFEIIGEATNKVDQNFLQQYPEFPYKDTIEMRNFLIHGYDQVELDVVWRTIKQDLPNLLTSVSQIIAANTH